MFSAVAIVVIGMPLVASGASLADTFKKDLEDTAKKSELTAVSPGSLPDVIGNFIGVILSLTGLVFFGLMVYGGFIWMMAHGNEQQTKEAFDTIIGAVIGILIIISAYAITSFIFSSLKKDDGATGATGSVAIGQTCSSVCEDTASELVCGRLSNCEMKRGQKSSQDKCVNKVSNYCGQYTSNEEGCKSDQSCAWK